MKTIERKSPTFISSFSRLNNKQICLCVANIGILKYKYKKLWESFAKGIETEILFVRHETKRLECIARCRFWATFAAIKKIVEFV
jgi:hypothetical protein